MLHRYISESYMNVCFSDTESVGTDDNTEVTLASIIRDGLEFANTDPSDMSLPLFGMMDNDRVFAQYSGTADHMPFSSMADVNKISAEVGSNRSIDNDLPVAMEAGDRGGSMHIESGRQGSRHQQPLLSGTCVGSSKLENDQQSDSSGRHDALEDLNAKDEVTAISSDLSQTSEMMLDVGIAYKLTESISRSVEFSDVENLSRNSHSAVKTTSTISEHSSEQPCKQVSDVIDGDKPAVGCKSPVPVEIQNEQLVFTSVSPAPSSVTGGTITHMVDSSINTAESVDDVHCYSPSEAEYVDGQLMLKGNASVEPGNDIDAPAVCSTEEALSVENDNILPTDSMEQDEVHLELSPVTHTVVDTAVSGSTSLTSPLVAQVECDIDKGAVGTGMSEPLNDTSIVPDAANAHESAADIDQTLMQNSEETYAEASERCTIETDATNNGDMNDDAHSSVNCEVELTNSSSSSSIKEQAVDEKSKEQSSDMIEVESSKTVGSPENVPVTDEEQKSISVSSVSCEVELTNISGSSSIKEQAVDEKSKEQSSDMIEVESSKTVGSPGNVPVTDEEQKSISVSSGALNCSVTGVNGDHPKELLARNETCEERPAYALERGAVLGTVSYITKDKQVNVLPLTKERPRNINTANKPAGIFSKSGDSCEADVVLSDDKVTLEPTTSVADVSGASSTVTNHVTDAVEPESHKESDSASCVVILKSSASLTQPSSVFIPGSSSAVLSDILPRAISMAAASSVPSSAGSMYQVPQNVKSSMKETQSSSCRPAAALAMNIGKNLVTEFVFREIVVREQKWTNATEAEKVPPYQLIYSMS